MFTTRLASMSKQFYDWEVRGRGWHLWDRPVGLEPTFVPLNLGSTDQLPDDGRRQSVLSHLVDRFLGAAPTPPSVNRAPIHNSEPRPYLGTGDLVELALTMPRSETTTAAAVSQLVLSLKHLPAPIAFEVVGTSNVIRSQFVCQQSAATSLTAHLTGHLADVAIRLSKDWLRSLWTETVDRSCIVDFGLSSEFMLPLALVDRFDVDPLSAIAAALSEVEGEEIGIVQVLFQEVESPWAADALRILGDSHDGPFFIDAPDFEKRACDKLRRPLFAAAIRVACMAANRSRAWDVARGLAAALGFSANPAGNSLVPLENSGYEDSDHVEDLLERRSRRHGMLLSVDELVSFVHPPSAAVREVRVEREIKKTRAAVAASLGNSLVLGTNEHLGRRCVVSQGVTQRLRHTYVIGSSGTGKSTLLLNMIMQDIESGRGCALLDPHGDLVDQVLERIPENRVEDVVLFDASDEAYPVGLNVLQAHSDSEKNLLASDLVEGFKRLSSTWGDQMTSVLGNAILAFLESSRGGTLADLRRFLVEPEYREQFLESVKDPEVVYYWRKEFSLLTGRPQAPLLTRLDTFLRPKLVRAIVNQKHDRLDFRWMMDGKKIFLGKLTQGAIGEENSYLLGTLIVTKIQQAALGRQNVPEAERVPFFLYIDEFHNFITPSVASILSGARKFGLGLILSHQELRQVVGQDADVAGAVIANPYTRVCFRLGDDDAKRLQSGFSSFDAKDLQSLGVGEAIVRMERAENDFTLTTADSPPLPTDAQQRRERIVALSRQRFGRRREDVEQETAASRESATEPAKRKKQPGRFGPPGKG